MAENKETKTTKTQAKTQEVKSASVGSKIEVVGPYDSSNGAQVFRFIRESDNKDDLDLVPGQTLSVGGNDGDITKQEADILLANSSWEFKSK